MKFHLGSPDRAKVTERVRALTGILKRHWRTVSDLNSDQASHAIELRLEIQYVLLPESLFKGIRALGRTFLCNYPTGSLFRASEIPSVRFAPNELSDSIRAIIIAAGKATRWGNHLGKPKHFAPVDGEPILNRTVRLLRERRGRVGCRTRRRPPISCEGVEAVHP